MPLKGKSNIISKITIAIVPLLLFVYSCSHNEKDEMTEAEKKAFDSISKIEQRKKSDSMKRTNPLLILPPDSEYTGNYIDKYETGITKFVGFYRQGKRHGQWMSFFPNGLAWSEMHYDKGLRQGPNLVYYNSGKLRYAGFYKNDLQDSVWTYYDSLGRANKKVIFKNDKVVKETELK